MEEEGPVKEYEEAMEKVRNVTEHLDLDDDEEVGVRESGSGSGVRDFRPNGAEDDSPGQSEAAPWVMVVLFTP